MTTETFNFPGRMKKITFALMAIGLLGIVLGLVFNEHPTRVWSNILLNSYYFVGIGLGGLFMTAAHQIGYGGWHVQFKRIFEAAGMFIPVAGIGILIVVLGMYFNWHHIYHWASSEAHHDVVLKGKSVFLNVPFFSVRVLLYVVIWSLFAMVLRRVSIKEDELGSLGIYKRNKTYAALFLIFFAITSSTASWDITMSIDPHWYSTLFGWYNLISYILGGIAFITLIVIYLRNQGHLPHVNEEHMHNLGMFMFGFSVFWAYLWFSQYMLIWYGNIPEETAYFYQRAHNGLFNFLFYTNLIINFFFPFLVLMTRGSKRKISVLAFVAIVMVIGHWIDFYLMVMPGSLGDHAGIGLIELSIFAGFAGAFLYVVFTTLTKSSLVPVNNPYLKESLQHHTLK